jgi:hypothetical protein
MHSHSYRVFFIAAIAFIVLCALLRAQTQPAPSGSMHFVVSETGALWGEVDRALFFNRVLPAPNVWQGWPDRPPVNDAEIVAYVPLAGTDAAVYFAVRINGQLRWMKAAWCQVQP